MQQTCQLNNSMIVPLDKLIKVGLSWDIIDQQEIDLDAQCLILNDIGEIEDAVYYNQLNSKVGKIVHSGDSLGEQDDFDEIITIQLDTVQFQIKYIAILICTFTGHSFSKVETASAKIFVGDVPYIQVSLGGLGNYNSCLVCLFQKNFEGNWLLWNLQDVDLGSTFLECEKLIKRNMVKVGFDEYLFMESKKWTGNQSFQLSKDKIAMIPVTLKEVRVGLGWDTNCDIDSSIILMDNDNNHLETIFYGNKQSSNHSVLHHGDNLTGIGSGDDETIEVHLDKLQEQVKYVWAVITIYTGGKQFDDVKGAYCRLYDASTKKEFCRFNLSKNMDNLSNGCIMCSIVKFKQNWGIQSRGYYTTNTKTPGEMVNIIQKIMKQDYSKITVMDHQLNKPEFKLRLVIIEGKQLGAFDRSGTSDPYAIVKVNEKQIGRSPTINKTLNPVWNYIIDSQFKVGDNIQVDLYDYDFMMFDDYMGSVFFKITDNMIKEPLTNLELPVLNDKKQKESKFPGQVNIQIILRK